MESAPGKDGAIRDTDFLYFFQIEESLTVGQSMERHDPDKWLVFGRNCCHVTLRAMYRYPCQLGWFDFRKNGLAKTELSPYCAF